MVMTKKVFFFTLLILLVALSFFFMRVKSVQKPLPSIKKAKTISPSVLDRPPLLYVKGNKIRRKDTDEIVQLKGVTSMILTNGLTSKNKFMKRLDRVKEWNINLLGIYINPYQTQGKDALLDEIVAWSRQNSIYLYVMPAINVKDTSHDGLTQVARFPQMLEHVAKRYKAEQHIMYGLWAEPRDIPWVVWEKVARSTSAYVRAHNPNAIILMTCVQYGRIFDEKNPLSIDNVICDFHDYPWMNAQEAQDSSGHLVYGVLWEKVMYDCPVLVGEFGGVYREDFGSKEDTDYIAKIIGLVNKDKLHYSAYTIDDEGELGIYDWNLNKPTQKGRIILEDLSIYPPTVFKIVKK